jgi:hypothetical protein
MIMITNQKTIMLEVEITIIANKKTIMLDKVKIVLKMMEVM